jgi:predicted RNase H-like nuclease (RuvC/YqgF family)
MEKSEKLNSQLSAELDALKAENSKLQAVIQEKEKSVDETDLAERQHFSDVEQLNATIRSLEEQIQESVEKVQRLESELAKYEHEGAIATKVRNLRDLGE